MRFASVFYVILIGFGFSPEIVVSHDCTTLACSCNCRNAVLCAADVCVSVIGGCNQIAVGGKQAQTIFAFLVEIDFPFGELQGFVVFQSLVFDRGDFGVVYDALHSDFCRAESGVGLRADCHDSVVGRVELKHKVAFVRFLMTYLP